MTPADIERAIKRLLSNPELAAISRLRDRLPKDRRQQKKALRRAREEARLVELGPKGK
jgi:hypothetical protein